MKHEENRPLQASDGESLAFGVPLAHFVEVLASVPAPVTVVTTAVGSRQHATTVSAFASLSASPPLVMLALDRSSDLLGLLGETDRFGVSVLSSGQEHVAHICSRKGPDKLASLRWSSRAGLPFIEGSAGWLACRILHRLSGGDHIIV